jgi:hypothetical protein
VRCVLAWLVESMRTRIGRTSIIVALLITPVLDAALISVSIDG